MFVTLLLYGCLTLWLLHYLWHCDFYIVWPYKWHSLWCCGFDIVGITMNVTQWFLHCVWDPICDCVGFTLCLTLCVTLCFWHCVWPCMWQCGFDIVRDSVCDTVILTLCAQPCVWHCLWHLLVTVYVRAGTQTTTAPPGANEAESSRLPNGKVIDLAK